MSTIRKDALGKIPSTGAASRSGAWNQPGLIAALLVAAAGLLLSFSSPNLLGHLPFWRTPDSTAPVDVLDKINSLTYRGIRNNEVEDFRNIFYAQDTGGKNRFAPPVPFLPAKGSIIDATREGAWCPQGEGPVLPFTSVITNTSENCLSVRITRPAGTKQDAKLPVVVWLHGGGHALGSTTDILYNPDGFITQSVAIGQPVIFAGLNYRLGFFGFATNQALQKAKHTNAGLRDQRAGLEWIKNNIANFGGDSSRVTVMGQSVGGCDIGLQLTAFGGKKGLPFDKAIMLSGAPGLNFETKSDAVAERTAAVAKEVGCLKENDARGQNTLACLREAPWETLVNKSIDMMRAARPPFGEAFFHPTYDNDFLPDYPSSLMRAGKFVKTIPLVATWTYNEGAWYQPPTTSTDDEVVAAISTWMSGLEASSHAKLLELYPTSDFEHLVADDNPISAQYHRAARINRDLWFTCPTIDFTWQYAKRSSGSSGGGGGDLVRLATFNQTRFAPAYELMGVPFWGVAHLSEIPYVLNTQELPAGVDSSAGQLELARAVSSEIIAFANAKGAAEIEAALRGWGPAYEGVAGGASNGGGDNDQPGAMKVKVFGGPHGGAGAVSISRSGGARDEQEAALAAEKLFVRCDFINSEKIRMELGV